MKGKLRTARIYAEPQTADGYRILADRLWPRGVKKADAFVDAWAKDIAPSNELRRSYHQDGDYDAFRKKYRKELDQNADTAAFIDIVREHLQEGSVTLLSASKDIDACNVSVLYEYLNERI